MRYRFRIDLRLLKRGPSAPPQDQIRLESEPGLGPLPPGDPRAEGYNRSLQWAERHDPGKFLQGKLQFHVFDNEETGARHVLSRPADQPHERVAEVVLYPEGSLISRTYVRREGEPANLNELFDAGLGILEEDAEAIRLFPGYELRTVAYEREGDQLLSVEAINRYYDARQDLVVDYPSEV